MKKHLPAVLLSLAALPAQAYQASTWSLTIDNDGAVGSDRDYSSGLFLGYHTPHWRTDAAPNWMAGLADWLPGSDRQSLAGSLRLGQMMWTPEHIEEPLPREGERPYAGLLFLEGGLARYAEDRADRYQLLFGTVGPSALAEEGQRFIHFLIGSDEPLGWDSQIEDQLVLNLDYRGDRRLVQSPGQWGRTPEISAVGRLRAGNFQSELAMGALFRWGENLGGSFASAGFQPGQLVDPGALGGSAQGQFLFTGVEGRYRFYDLTIEGDRPAEVPDTSVEPLQASVVLGYVFYRPSWGVSVTFEAHSRAYQEADQPVDGYASVGLFWRLP
ncbi:lipid A deacylase LpxR family protein [Ferrimonas balearica]|uniref:lipid A deacylase LpxR family protein n=1 Tax=Ferrimonas balearica TaxID=44012 RepID=UPI001C9983DC|nr:lipid A deacylase LpxR family protein [Ferrimonas balearica]MBY5992421.1 lipid A deacylase LpxR family protein [Ferrimonas balearica]